MSLQLSGLTGSYCGAGMTEVGVERTSGDLYDGPGVYCGAGVCGNDADRDDAPGVVAMDSGSTRGGRAVIRSTSTLLDDGGGGLGGSVGGRGGDVIGGGRGGGE